MIIKNKHIKNVVIIAMLCTSILLIYITFNRVHNNDFSCEADLIVNKDNSQLTLNISYTFNDTKGFVEANGELFENGHLKLKINREFPFTYIKNQNQYILISQQSIDYAEVIKVLRPVIPDFYLFRDRSYKLEIIKQPSGDYLFVTDQLPIFLCKIRQ
ncbi:MAG: hypothetical protein ACRDCA_03200 [Serratia sp. (in: enterobacteria)]|uniref:hypothetical protein n=1 Tax=Serratia sp. (in: enterobacteria) TaxID=616 RepID=UPI003F38F8D5